MTSSFSVCRPGLEELKMYLQGLGANEVITEEFLTSYHMKELLKVYKEHVICLYTVPLFGSCLHKNSDQEIHNRLPFEFIVQS